MKITVFVLFLMLLTACGGDLVVFSDVNYTNEANDGATAVQVVGDNSSASIGQDQPQQKAGRPVTDWSALLGVYGAIFFFIFVILYTLGIGPFSSKYDKF